MKYSVCVCYSLFYNFLSLYEKTLKGQSLENGLFYIFQAIGNMLLFFIFSLCKYTVFYSAYLQNKYTVL